VRLTCLKTWGRSLFALLLFACGWGVPVNAQGLAPQHREQMLQADIVLLGEIHDNPLHHLGQAALLRQIVPNAVVFEMLDAQQAKIMNNMGRDDLAALAQQIDWAGSGWPPFALYEPVFAALGDVRVVGAAASREQVRAAFANGAAATFGAGAPDFGLEAALPIDELNQRTELQFEAHCAAMPLEMMGGMVEAQRFRDARFSAAALDALNNYGAPIVVVAGNGHVRRDWGMPALIALAAPDVTTFAIGFVESAHSGDDPRYDARVVTSAPARGDPCAAFD
jgi:uncharacterized iron-regulated protein